jgi:hypothetical protein
MLKVAILISLFFSAGPVHSNSRLIQSQPQPLFDKELCETNGDGTYDVKPSHKLVVRAKITCKGGNLYGESRYWLKRPYSSASSWTTQFASGMSVADSPTENGYRLILPPFNIVIDKFPEYLDVDFGQGHVSSDHVVVRSPSHEFLINRASGVVTIQVKFLKNSKHYFEGFWKTASNISPGKHGIFRTWWPNGKKRKVEYWCENLPVGFHVEYNRREIPKRVTDFSKSDFLTQGRRTHLRSFYTAPDQSRGLIQSATTDNLGRVQLFAETFELYPQHAKRIAFSAGELFQSDFFPLSLETTIENWITPGVTWPMTIRLGGDKIWIVNEDFGYVSFDKLYKQVKMNNAPLPANEQIIAGLMACPWIDQAMSFGINDKRFTRARAISQ